MDTDKINQPRKHTEAHGNKYAEPLILNPVFEPQINADKVKGESSRR
jgi:hypothetical protein